MRILIADADTARAKGIAEACGTRAGDVERVSHGAAALERALERIPDVVICPLDLPVIDGGRLAEILRGNPRTRGASFVFLAEDELDAPVSMDPRDATVGAPWDPDQVLEHVRAMLERAARLGEVRADAEMEGKLSQITVPDLLQLFQMNHKNGVLRVTRAGDPSPGSIVIRAGQVVDAGIPLEGGGSVVGEKALFRMLSWKEGRFRFLPGSPPAGGRIRGSTRALLLEGMQQADEAEQQRRSLPRDDARLRLVLPRDRLPAGLHPLAREVIAALEAHPRVGDVLDHCPLPDDQVLRVLADLMRRKDIEVEAEAEEGEAAIGEGGIFTPTQVRRLRERAASERSGGGPVVKVLAIAAGPALLQGLEQALRECPGFQGNPRLAGGTGSPCLAGSLGRFLLGESLEMRVIGVAADPFHAPLREVAAHGSLGTILLPGGPDDSALEAVGAALAREGKPRAVLRLLRAEDEEGARGARETPGALLAGAFFVLPPGPSPERLPILRNVFARLLP